MDLQLPTPHLQALVPSLDDYEGMLAYRELERRKNRHAKAVEAEPAPLQKIKALDNWLGTEYIKFLTPGAETNTTSPFIKGDTNQVSFISPETIQYSDHVSRIQTSTNLGPAIFTKPCLSPDPQLIYEIPPTPGDASPTNHDVLRAVPEPYSYCKMEDKDFMMSNIPVDVGLPPSVADTTNFIFNEHAQVTQCVLHLPVKLPKTKCQELNLQGRVPADEQPFCERKYYLPIDFEYLVPFINHATENEVLFNPYFFEHYYLFVSVSHSYVNPFEMQRRGGWHVDGHQGYERIQTSGSKLFTDRQYTISNVLPTEYVVQTFCFDKLREYLKQECCSMDSVNFQHVLEEHVTREISQKGHQNCVRTTTPNSMTFFNPYVVHKAAVNSTEKPVLRTF